jgi:hypothetical protein
MAIKGLGITDSTWFEFDPLKKIGNGTQFDSWFFTGFYFRFMIIAFTIFLAIRKQYRASVFVYLFAASLLIIHKGGFRSQPFIIVAVTVISAVISGECWQGEKEKILRTAQRTIVVLSCFIIFWILIRSAGVFARNRTLLSYAGNVGEMEADARNVKSFACGEANVKLAMYPGAVYYHWFTDLQPVSKYLFMFPWVAEIALDDVIRELAKKDELAIVIIDYDTPVWDKYVPKEYLHPLIDYLEKNYVKEADGLFVSPELARRQRLRRHQLGRAEGSAL